MSTNRALTFTEYEECEARVRSSMDAASFDFLEYQKRLKEELSKLDTRVYNKIQIAKGLDLANQWFEGWRLDALDIDQLFECIEKANL